MQDIRVQFKKAQEEKRLVVNAANPDKYLRKNPLPFHDRAQQQIDDDIMRRAVAKAQNVIGANRAKIMAELGDVEGWLRLGKLGRPSLPALRKGAS